MMNEFAYRIERELFTEWVMPTNYFESFNLESGGYPISEHYQHPFISSRIEYWRLFEGLDSFQHFDSCYVGRDFICVDTRFEEYDEQE